MANNNGQSKGKVILIDPNKVNDSSTGALKPEDLFVYVDLEVEKKPRTIISINDSPNTNNDVINRTGPNRIGFLEGSSEPGRDNSVLTTNYTRLTTVLIDENGESDSESFGIKNISIEFNSSFAPLIKIEFVDLRGSTLFERGNSSKYGLFFDLPYPMFKLTVKGYYGPAVTYCLHLLKFNSSFNSETGNFEITCNFIGYTFAFLSDMLLGYLRATPETRRGRELFNERKAIDPNLLTINEMIDKLGEAKNKLGKTAATNNDVKALNSGKNIIDKYKEYNRIIAEFIRALGENKVIAASKGVNKEGVTTNSHMYVFGNLESLEKVKETYFKKLDDYAAVENKNIIDEIYRFPVEAKKKIKIYPNFKKDTYQSASLPTFTDVQKSKYDSISKRIKPDNGIFIIGDFSDMVDTIKNKQNNINKDINTLSVKLSSVVDGNIKSVLGFAPNIYNFVNIFTTHVEIYLELIRETSIAAMNSVYRTNELESLSQDTLNISETDIKSKTFYPWPEYNENGQEEWIGKNIGIIAETELVEEMLEGLLKTQQSDNMYSSLLYDGTEAYTPTNVFDLPIYKNRHPYDELLTDADYKGNVDEVLLASTTRLFNYAECNAYGYNAEDGVDPFYQNIFEIYGKLEAKELYNSLIKLDFDKKIINSLLNYKNGNLKEQISSLTDLMLNGSDKIALPNGISPVIVSTNDGDTYDYVYIRDKEGDNVEFPEYVRRGYLPNFVSPSKYKRFYGDDSLLLPFDSLKEEFKEENYKYPQYHGYGDETSNIIAEFNTDPDEITISNTVIDDGSTYWRVSETSEWNYTYNFPNVNSLLSKTVIKTPTQTIEINSDVTPTPEKDTSPVTYSQMDKSVAQPYRGYVLNSEFRVNDMRNIIFDKQVNFFNSGSTASSAAFFYKDAPASYDHVWYAACPFKTDSELYDPAFFYGNTTTFSPLCYSVSKATREKPSLFGLAGGATAGDVNNSDDDIPTTDSSEISEETINQLINQGINVSNSESYEFTHDYQIENNNYTEQSSTDLTFVDKTTHKTIKSWFESSTKSFSHLLEENREESTGEQVDFYDLRADQGDVFDDKESLDLIGKNQKGISTVHNGYQNTTQKQSIALPLLCTFGANKTQLFGSELYFEQQQNNDYQDAIRARAYLFLHTLPMYGNFRSNAGDNSYGQVKNNILYQPGLQEVPYAWILYMGSEMWYRDNETNGKIYYESPEGDVIVAGLTSTPYKGSEWLSEGALYPLTDAGNGWVGDVSQDNFPKGFKDYCKEEFKLWTDEVNTGNMSWNTIRRKLEIIDYDNLGDIASARAAWRSRWKNFKYTRDYISNNFNTLYNPYNVIQPYIANDIDFKSIKIDGDGDIPAELLSGKYRYDYNCFLNYKDSGINDMVWGFMGITKVLAKRVGLVDREEPFGDDTSRGIKSYLNQPTISTEKYDEYFNGFFTELGKLLAQPEASASNKDELKKQVFKTVDNDLIRLNIYRQLSAIYNKWVGGSQNNITIPCVSNLDENDRLIDRFQFIDRAYHDIGKTLIINPFQIVSYLQGQLNQSFYDLVGSKVLANNNMDFMALPTYINFRDQSEIEEMFKTHNVNTSGKFRNIGPSFVCVYIGQTSQYLDLGNTSDNVNDGIDFVNEDGELKDEVATDMVDSSGNKIPVFVVNYADPNQSIFKNLKMDQVEFSETDESLQIINSLSSNKKEFIGQNLFNVYSVRSYTVEAEMLGNMTIQPYMYFQLNNIPMYHGGYMILKVTHEIEANHVKTRFKGTRIRRVKTPLITEDFIYLNILNEFNDGTLEANSITDSTNVPDYTISDENSVIVKELANGSMSKTFDADGFTLKQLYPKFANSDYGKYGKNYSDVDSIVVHCTDGTTLDSAVRTLYGKNCGYHFIIDRNGDQDGVVVQTTPLDKAAHHAGHSYGPQGKNVNGYSIGISFVLWQSGGNKQVPTAKQWASFNALVKQLVDERAKEDVTPFKWITFHHYVQLSQRADIFYLKDDVEKVGKANGLNMWLAGMPPFPSGLSNCECATYETINGIKTCTSVKAGNSCTGPGGYRYSPDLMILPNGIQQGQDRSPSTPSDGGLSDDSAGTVNENE